MHYVISPNVWSLTWVALLACFLKTDYTLAASDDLSLVPKLLEDTNSKLELGMSKREWNRNLHSWGKRAWQNLQGGWGKRDAYPLHYNYIDKPWQTLQGAWGKLYIPEYSMMSLKNFIEQEQEDPQYTDISAELEGTIKNPQREQQQQGMTFSDYDTDTNDEKKRAWKGLGGGWGKRADNWGNFRGSWGKRDPAWNNLKGIWGKRSIPMVTQ